MNHKTKLGAITNQVGGLYIRLILDHNGNHTGKFGIYAGKKLYQAQKYKANAILLAQKAQSDKPSHFPFRSAFLKWKNNGKRD